MIGYFPEPYPDELLYSVCGRYSDRVKYPNFKSLLRELFGERASIAAVDLPSHLNHLVTVLPLGHCYTVDRLIDEHTLLPFYSPFCPLERVNRTREDMRGDEGFPHGHLSLSIVVHNQKNWLRFCPLCVEADRKQYGESYWHRLHQLSGVEVCPVHAVFLEDSNIPIRHRGKSCEFISAEQRIQPTSVQPLELSNPSHEALLKIAHDAVWLLSQRNLVADSEILSKRYLRVLSEQQLASYKGYVYTCKLVDKLNKFYSPDLLKLLHCEINKQSKEPWPSRLVRPTEKVRHPIQHLLLIQFLGYTAEYFFQISDEFKPFGEGAWPCLNPVCENFQQLKIEKCEIHYNSGIGCRPVGIFKCRCGFMYSRIGPDCCPEDTFRFSKVESYGSTWEIALKNLWKNSEVSLSEIASQLGVSHNTVKRHAVWLELPFPRQGPRIVEINASLMHRWKDSYSRKEMRESESYKQDRLESYKQEWLAVRKANPTAGRRSLKRRFAALHSWLKRYAPEWLEANMPARQKMTQPKQQSRVDWESFDTEFVTALRASATRIKNAPGRPVRITKSLLGRDIGKSSKIRDNLNKLPLTYQTLAELVETYEEFAIRKVEWAAECFRQKNIYPARSQLVCHAGVYKLIAVPQVKDAVDTALKSLESLSSVDRWRRVHTQPTSKAQIDD